MPRPRTKGDAYSIRLSIEADGELKRRAREKGVDPRIWLESALETALATKRPAPAVATPASPHRPPRRNVAAVAAACTHPKAARRPEGKIPGLTVCTDCGAKLAG
jgi:hypothetical protein